METLTYTVEEVAKLLRIGRNNAYERVRAGDIPSIPMGGRCYRIPRERFHAWVNGSTPDTNSTADTKGAA